MFAFSDLAVIAPITSDKDIVPYIIAASVSFVIVIFCITMMIINKKKRK